MPIKHNSAYDPRELDAGASRWASLEEMQSSLTYANLNAPHVGGVPVIADPVSGSAWVSAGPEHTLIYGGTCSGKTRRVILQTIRCMARAGESLLVNDPKGELFEQTSGELISQGYDVKVLNFRDPAHSNGWSFLHEAADMFRSGNEEEGYALINQMAAAFFPITGKIDPFWPQTSRSLFAGISGVICQLREGFNDQYSIMTIQQLVETLSEDYSGVTLQTLARFLPNQETNMSSILLKNALRGSEKTTDNVLVSMLSGLASILSSPSLARMLSTPDIDFRMLGQKKSALFIVIPDENTTFHELASLVVAHAYSTLIKTAQACGGKLPVRVNFVLDEFGQLPAIANMPSALAAGRSRRVRYVLVCQDRAQLASRYDGDDANIVANCANVLYFYTREMGLLRELSELAGCDARGRALISASQLQRLPFGDCLCFIGRNYPYMTHLADYSEYRCFPEASPMPMPTLNPKPLKLIPLDAVRFNLDVRRPHPERRPRRMAQRPPEAPEEQADDDLQQMLEERFDQLFGQKPSASA